VAVMDSAVDRSMAMVATPVMIPRFERGFANSTPSQVSVPEFGLNSLYRFKA